MRLFPLLLVAATPALAEVPPRLIAAVSGDWDGDEVLDAALLYAGEQGNADLVVMLGTGHDGLREVLRLPEVAFSGPMAGQFPTLAPYGDHGFLIRSEQTGVGRTPWFQTITVDWREGDLRVVGFDYSFYDRLDLTHEGGCSVDLLTGRFVVDILPGDARAQVLREGHEAPSAFPLADLRAGFFPQVCAAVYD